ncbi:MAG: DUF4258 domain-containing protein [Proteobacteria bacterium]|nr:DUF4258 domain-containing protein [Pseudomonadota bacterium]
MFTRNIAVDEVVAVLGDGEAIETYPDDTPYPSCLLVGKPSNRILHVVAARNSVDALCIVITAYEPSPRLWQPDFKTRNK